MSDERRDYYGGGIYSLSLSSCSCIYILGFLLSSAQRSVLSVPLAISRRSAQQSSMQQQHSVVPPPSHTFYLFIYFFFFSWAGFWGFLSHCNIIMVDVERLMDSVIHHSRKKGITTTTTFHSFPVVVVVPTGISFGDDVMENVLFFFFYEFDVFLSLIIDHLFIFFYCRRSFFCFLKFTLGLSRRFNAKRITSYPFNITDWRDIPLWR